MAAQRQTDLRFSLSQSLLPAATTTSRSKAYALNAERGIWLPAEFGFETNEEFDRHGRPRRVNLKTISDFYSHDILAFDRAMLPESNRLMPLFPPQRLIFEEMMKRQFLFVEMMRGGSKTYSFARAFLNYALMVPGTPILLTGPSFRQSLMVFDEVVKLIELNAKNKNSNWNIKDEIVGEVKRGTMEAVVRLRNGSLIKAMPLGDGTKIRGLRGGVLFIDEGYQLEEEMYESHLAPFVGVKQGNAESKIVIATTSWYQDCYAYKRLMQIASEVKAGNPLYGILDFNLDDLLECGFPLSEAVHKDAKRHGDPLRYLMTYYNIWPDSQARWYEQKAIDSALSSGHRVSIELKNVSDDKYFAVIDLAASEKGDSTCLLVARNDGKKTQWVWGKKGRGWSGHRRAWEAHEVIKRYAPEFVIYDAHGAIGKDFRTDMALDVLVFNDENGQRCIKEVTPVIHHDERNKRGRQLLIPVSPRDEAVVMALTGVKDGFMDGEAGMMNLLHTKTRNLLWEGQLVGPGIDAVKDLPEDVAQKTAYVGSPQDALDVVREAFAQLGKMSLDKDVNGNQKTTATGQPVFKKKSGASVDDGAYCLVYGSIGSLRLNGYTTDRTRGTHIIASEMSRTIGLTDGPLPADGGANFQKITFA